MKEALVVGDLLSGVQQRVGFLLGEGVGAPDDGDGEDGVDDDDHGDRLGRRRRMTLAINSVDGHVRQ